jgi:predicted acyl esterase
MLYSPKELNGSTAPAILCLQGGGNVGLDNYLYEPEFFAENGFVSLVCDKRGAGSSVGTTRWQQQSFAEKVEEYWHLIEWLKKQDHVNPDKVGVHGLSEGGRLAIAMSIERPEEIAFSINVSGPLESYKENRLYAIFNYLNQSNPSYSILIEAVSTWDQYLDEIARNEISERTVARTIALQKNSDFTYLPDPSTELPERPRPEDVHYSLPGELSAITSPTLFQYGALDQIVNATNSMALIPEKEIFNIINYSNTDHNMTLPNGDVHPDYDKDKLLFLEQFKN